MTDPHLTALALGSDLTNLGGLDLNSNEVLYPTFTSPWSDRDGSGAYARRRHHRERHFELPKCYYVQPPALKTSHLAKFTLETLFYIFYNMPRDTLQVYAAKELVNRHWIYYKKTRIWITQVQKDPKSNPELQYFCIQSWTRKQLIGPLDKAHIMT